MACSPGHCVLAIMAQLQACFQGGGFTETLFSLGHEAPDNFTPRIIGTHGALSNNKVMTRGQSLLLSCTLQSSSRSNCVRFVLTHIQYLQSINLTWVPSRCWRLKDTNLLDIPAPQPNKLIFFSLSIWSYSSGKLYLDMMTSTNQSSSSTSYAALLFKKLKIENWSVQFASLMFVEFNVRVQLDSDCQREKERENPDTVMCEAFLFKC